MWFLHSEHIGWMKSHDKGPCDQQSLSEISSIHKLPSLPGPIVPAIVAFSNNS